MYSDGFVWLLSPTIEEEPLPKGDALGFLTSVPIVAASFPSLRGNQEEIP
jgi:hypothetical protein